MKNFTKTMRFYKSIYHFWFSLIITGFELLGTGNNCLTLESISLEVGFLRAPQFSSWVRFTTSFIMLSLMRTSLTECLWDMKEWYISNLRVRERYCRQFDGKKPHWFIFLMNPLILRIFPRFYSFYFFYIFIWKWIQRSIQRKNHNFSLPLLWHKWQTGGGRTIKGVWYNEIYKCELFTSLDPKHGKSNILK